jgi:hypothetical protein
MCYSIRYQILPDCRIPKAGCNTTQESAIANTRLQHDATTTASLLSACSLAPVTVPCWQSLIPSHCPLLEVPHLVTLSLAGSPSSRHTVPCRQSLISSHCPLPAVPRPVTLSLAGSPSSRHTVPCWQSLIPSHCPLPAVPHPVTLSRSAPQCHLAPYFYLTQMSPVLLLSVTKSGSTSLSNALRLPKGHCFSEGSQPSPVRPSDKFCV